MTQFLAFDQVLELPSSNEEGRPAWWNGEFNPGHDLGGFLTPGLRG
ncbi:hypothetical protein [Sinomicrobium weinanense]|uniref:Uncharacterized protein n=1 Tax=Sinomicrobium weinanense TaxID=2842200 RepID=A0A926JTK8_9FLAO|nr:hypothetical protein [Sinomicrobium weinanense]MBC9797131.1 hypothetical protein [Sinomicrobium weinanense]